jgi:hypothetical protein
MQNNTFSPCWNRYWLPFARGIPAATPSWWQRGILVGDSNGLELTSNEADILHRSEFFQVHVLPKTHLFGTAFSCMKFMFYRHDSKDLNSCNNILVKVVLNKHKSRIDSGRHDSTARVHVFSRNYIVWIAAKLLNIFILPFPQCRPSPLASDQIKANTTSNEIPIDPISSVKAFLVGSCVLSIFPKLLIGKELG